MYPGNSTLCYGVQWDAVMRWISRDSSLVKYLKNSTGKGNYSDVSNYNIGKTGMYEMKNIYDMAGNVFEWTMEGYITPNDSYITYVLRGGLYKYSGDNAPVTCRRLKTQGIFNYDLGFRVTYFI